MAVAIARRAATASRFGLAPEIDALVPLAVNTVVVLPFTARDCDSDVELLKLLDPLLVRMPPNTAAASPTTRDAPIPACKPVVASESPRNERRNDI